MRPTSSKYVNPTGPIDKRIGSRFELLENVYDSLPQITHLSYYLESLFNLDRNLTLLSDENVSHHILKDITFFQGASAYELAVANGFQGTLQEWLDSLHGLPGIDGLDGIIDPVLLAGIEANIASNLQLINAQALNISNIGASLSEYVRFDGLTNLDLSSNISLLGINTSLTTALQQTEASILAQIPTNSQLTTIAQNAVASSFTAVDAAIATVDGRVNAANLLLDGLRDDLDDGTTAFNDFLIQNDQYVIRLTAQEAKSGANEASIITLNQVSAESASSLITLQAESDTHASGISTLNLVTANAATQINVLQTTTGNNFASITNLQTVQANLVLSVDALELEVDGNYAYSLATRALTEGNATSITALGVRTTTAESSIITLQNVQGAQATQLTTLSSRTDNTESSIVTLQATKADQSALTAEALRITRVESRIKASVPPGIATGVLGTVTFTKNATGSGYNAGEIRVNTGELELPTGGSVGVGAHNLNTAFEGTVTPINGATFYILWSQADASVRFSGVTTTRFVICWFDDSTEEWKYLETNTSNSHVFTPVDDDKIVAAGYKEAGDTEITSLISFISFSDVRADVTSIQATKADKTELYDVASAIQLDRVAAETAASAAGVSELNAATSETNAAGSEAASLASQNVTASLARSGPILPSTFEFADEYFTPSLSSAPDIVSGVTTSSKHTYGYDSDGHYIETDGEDWMSTRGLLPFVIGDTYQMRVIAKEVQASTNGASYWAGLRILKGDYTQIGARGAASSSPGTSLTEFTRTYVATQADWDNGVRFLRATTRPGNLSAADGDGIYRTYLLEFKNISQEANAEDSAQAAATSASTAQVSETAAGQSATAAEVSNLAAQTAESNAQTSETNAATSETNASGSASSAATSASNAATSENNAGSSASAAATSESNAATEATNAGVEAAAAASSAVTASTAESAAIEAATATGPKDFSQGPYFHSRSPVNTAPGVKLDLLSVSSFTLESTSDGDVFRFTGDGTRRYISPKRVLPAIEGHTYRYVIRVRCQDVIDGTGRCRPVIRTLNEDYTTNLVVKSSVNNLTENQIITIEQDYTVTASDIAAGVHYIGSDFWMNYFALSGGGYPSDVFDVLYYFFEDITAQTLADDAASAAATSETNAAASETAAGQSATAASASEVAAQTAETNASASETAAATSETNASGSESAAATSATNAANSANTAGNEASAAATSASNAATSATNAATSSSAAQTSETNAATSASNASVSESNSATSETNAASSSASAATSVTLAARVGQRLITDNSVFSSWNTTEFPVSWADNSGATGNITKGVGLISENAVELVGPAGSNSQIRSTIVGETPPGWYIVELDVELLAGSFDGVGVRVQPRSDSSSLGIINIIDARNDTDQSGVAPGAGTVGRRYMFQKLVEFTNSTTKKHRLYLSAHAVQFGSTAVANEIRAHKCGIRPASQVEIDGGRIPAIEASVTTNASAIATTDGNLSATVGFGVQAGTSGAQLELVALDGGALPGSSARISADKIILDGTIDAIHLKSGTIYNVAETSETSATSVNDNGTTWTANTCSTTIVSVGKKLRISVHADAFLSPASTEITTGVGFTTEHRKSFKLRLRRGSTTIATRRMGFCFAPKDELTPLPSPPATYDSLETDITAGYVFEDTPGAGSHTYHLQFVAKAMSGGSDNQKTEAEVWNKFILIEEFDN